MPGETLVLKAHQHWVVLVKPLLLPLALVVLAAVADFLPSVPGVPDVQTQTLETAVSEAVLGRLSPDKALKDAAGRATQLLQANLDKFGR